MGTTAVAVPTASTTVPDATGGRPLPPLLRARVLVPAAVLVAAVSLLAGHAPTYDVWAWLVWGREIAHLDLNTVNGPAWKPLPVAVAAVLSPAGSAMPLLWLVVARAGGLLALAGAARLAWRVSGPFAALAAAVSLATVHLWLGYLLPYGMSEPLLAAFVLWAVDRHVAGRPATAWWLLVGAALLRPEIWPFLGGYAGWQWFRRHRGVEPAVHPAVLAGGLALVPLAWFVPQWFGSRHPFRLGQGQVAPGGPLDAAHPGLAALHQLDSDLLLWTIVGAAAGIIYAIAVRHRLLLFLAAVGGGWALLVAAMTQFGLSSGVSRYLVVTHAAAAVLAGVGWVEGSRWLYRQVRGATRLPRWPAAALPALVGLAVAAVSLSAFADDLRPSVHDVRHQQAVYEGLPKVVAAAGGRDTVLKCGRPWVDPLQVTFTAWTMRMHIASVRSLPLPGSVDAQRGPMFQTTNRIGDPVSPVPFGLFSWAPKAQVAADGVTWTVLESCR